MKHITKKLLPALLPALLALFLFPAPAKAATTHMITANTQLSLGYTNNGDIITTGGLPVTSIVAGSVITVDTTNGPVTITLQDIDITSANNQHVINIIGANDCTIILDGTVKLTATGNGDGIRYGGAGTLTIEDAAYPGSVISGGSNGIYADGSVNISGTTGAISGGGSGIRANGDVNISGTTGAISGVADSGISAGGDVNISGMTGDISSGGAGIYADGSVNISGMTGDISGGGTNNGIYALSGSVTVSGRVDSISGGSADVRANNGTYALLDYTGSLLTHTELDPAAYWLVTFEAYGGVGAPKQAYVTQNNVAIPAFAAPTKAGDTFGGWYTDNGTFANQWILGTAPVTTGGMTLYAKWTASPPSGSSYTGSGYFPPAPTKKPPEAPKPTFPTSGNVVGKRITAYMLDTLKGKAAFRMNKNEQFTLLELTENGKVLLIQKGDLKGYIAIKDIKATFGAQLRGTATVKKASVYTVHANGKLKRIGHYPKDTLIGINGVDGGYLISNQPNVTYYLKVGEWKLAKQ